MEAILAPPIRSDSDRDRRSLICRPCQRASGSASVRVSERPGQRASESASVRVSERPGQRASESASVRVSERPSQRASESRGFGAALTAKRNRGCCRRWRWTGCSRWPARSPPPPPRSRPAVSGGGCIYNQNIQPPPRSRPAVSGGGRGGEGGGDGLERSRCLSEATADRALFQHPPPSPPPPK